MTENFENKSRNRTIKELKAEAIKLGHTGFPKLNKAQLIDLLKLNPLSEPVPEINVPVLKPKPDKEEA